MYGTGNNRTYPVGHLELRKSTRSAHNGTMKAPNSYYRSAVTAPRALRVLVGFLLVVGGIFGFLPVLGFWMIPLGLLVVFFEVPWVRGLWRRSRAWWKEKLGRRGGSARDKRS